LRRDGGNNGIVLFTNSSTRSTDGGTGNSTIRTDYGNLLLGAGGSQHILTTAGNVGIGTTNPTQRLEVQGNAQIGNDSVTNIGLKITRLNGGIRTSEHTYHSSQNSPWYTYGQNLNWTNELAGTVESTQAYRPYFEAFAPAVGYKIFGFMNVTAGAFTNTNMVNSLVLKSDGNVGIGTTNPVSALHIYSGNGTSQIFNQLQLTNMGTPNQGDIVGMGFAAGESTQYGVKASIGFVRTGNFGIGDLAFYANRTTGISSVSTTDERLRIQSNGNVGIGLASSLARLHIMEPNGANDNVFQRWSYTNSVGVYDLLLKQTVTSSVVRYNFSMINNSTSYLNVLVLDRGNVGIGTTNPDYQLTVIGANQATANVTDAGNKGGSILVGSSVNATNQGGSVLFATLNDAGNYTPQYAIKSLFLNGNGYGLGDLAFSSRRATGDTSLTESVRFTYDGKVGIGTAIPSSPLHVFNTSTTLATFTRDLATDAGFAIGADNNGTVLSTIGVHAIQIYTNNTEKARITSDGKLGIGTNTPTTLLSVGGAGSTTAASGITLGGDAAVNLYRLSASVLKTDADFTAASLSSSSYVYAASYLQTAGGQIYAGAPYGTLSIFVGNIAQNAWENALYIGRGSYVGIGTSQPSGKLHIVSSVAGETVLRADGTNGTLFSVVDDLSDSLMSVNNSAGLPVFEVFADDRVVAGQYGSGDFVLVNNKVGIGTSNPVNKLSVIGGVNIGSNTYNVSAPTNGLIVQGDVGIGTTSAATYSSKIAVETSLTRGLMLFNPALADAGTLYGLGFGYAMSNYDSAYIGFYKVGASNTLNRLSFSLWNQNDVLNILGNGNVGIGTTNPTAKLHVSGINGDEVQIGTIGSSQIVGGRSGGSFSITTKSTSNGNLILEANAAMYLRTNASNESVYIALNGNVGINTTGPVQKLQVEGVVGNPAFVGTTQSGIFRISNTTDNATLDFGIRAGGNGAWIQSTDETSLAANYSLLLNPNGGFVGVGTTVPIASLDVENSVANIPVLNLAGGIAGNGVSDLYVLNSYNNNSGVGYAAKVIGVNISGSLTAQNIPLQRTTWGGVTSATAIALGTDGPRAGTQDNAFQIWTTNDGAAGTSLTQKFSLTSAGDVGIGTVSPAYKLQVAGTAYISALLDVSSVGATSNTEGIRFGGDSEANIYRSATDTLKTDGNLVVAGGLTVAGTTTLNDNLYGSKTVNLSTSAWTTVLTISMVNHTSCYVKLGAFGDWSNHSAIAFISELFVQNGANGFNQPGTIISAYDNTAGVASDKVDIQIVDPLAAGTQNYLIQLKLISATSYSNVSTKITYHIMGQQGAVS
jgi:hypothetical protein